MDAQKKNLIYKALAVTFAIMFFSVFFSQVIYEQKMEGINNDLSILRSSIDEARLVLSLKNVYLRKARKKNQIEVYLQNAADTIYNTGTKIAQLADSDRNKVTFERFSREWVLLAANAWTDLLRNSYKKRVHYILFLYPPKCNECIAYRTVLTRLHRRYGSKIWILAVPALKGNSVVDLMKNYYDIEDVPAIVVNGRLLKKDESLDRVETILKEQGLKPELKKEEK